jgi:hypothetical protein
MNIIDRLELEINRYEKSPMRIHPHAIKLCIDAKREIEVLKETAKHTTKPSRAHTLWILITKNAQTAMAGDSSRGRTNTNGKHT